MKIEKILNNNCILTLDEKGQEVIAMGSGIAFSKKKGDFVEQEKIEKTFVISNASNNELFKDLYKEMSEEEIDVLIAIVNRAEEVLDTKFGSNLYIALVDHINFALSRKKEGISLKNPLSRQISRFFKKEMEVGRYGLKIINEKLSVELDEDEAASIALHFVNSRKDGSFMPETMHMTKLMNEMEAIVRHSYIIKFDEDSLDYHRFITHLQFFAQRVTTNTPFKEDDSFLYDQISSAYSKAFETSMKIKKFVESNYDFKVSKDEMVYLTVHIHRITNNTSIKGNK